MDTEESRQELWHKLNNESSRAYEAFKAYMYLPPAERTAAWREWTENPEAARRSPFFEGWAREYAWSERARAHDHHIELIRERGMEKAIEEEAEFQARQVEQVRFRYNEMLSSLYERAMQWIEDSDWTRGDLRAADVVKIVALHAEAIDKLEDPNPAGNLEGDWDEEEDDEIGRRIVEEVDAAAEERRSEADDTEPESKDEDDWTEEDEAAIDQIVKEIDAITDLERPDGEEEGGEDSDNTERDLE
jgi:hypothetical protein